MTEGPRSYRLVGLGGDEKRIVVVSGVSFENAEQTLNEFTDYPLFDRLLIEDEQTSEPKVEWLRPQSRTS